MDATLIDILDTRAAEEADKCAFIFLEPTSTKEMTYSELAYSARLMASQITKMAGKGERVLLLLPSGLDYIITFFACLYAGVIAVPAYPPRNSRHNERLESIIQNSDPSLIVTLPEIAKRNNFTQKVFVVNNDLLKRNTRLETAPESLDKIPPEQIAFLQYSSGSTSQPKGVIINHANVMANCKSLVGFFKKGAISSVCSWLPFYHDMGLIGSIIYPVYTGVPSIFMTPIYFLSNPMVWLRTISDYKTTFSPAPNFAYQLCVDKISEDEMSGLDLSQWRIALNGSEPVSLKTISLFCKKFSRVGFKEEFMYPAYGMAEATVIISGKAANTPNIIHDKWVGCGTAAPEHEIKIIDNEICFKGPSVAQGYWNQKELAQTVFRNYLHTGDLGFLDAAGTLFITGRKKDLIIVRGQNYYPQDIEELVSQSHPDLIKSGCAAFSVRNNDNDTERIVVVQEVQRHFKSADDIFKAVNKNIAENYQLAITDLILIRQSSIPKTSSGKIQRNQTKIEWQENRLKIEAEWHEAEKLSISHNLLSIAMPKCLNDIERWIQQWVQLHKNLTFIDSNTAFAEFGFDSLMSVEFCSELSQWLNLSVNPTILWEYPTIADVTHYLGERLQIINPALSEKTINSHTKKIQEPIAIIGMSCRFPANIQTPEQLWDFLKNQGNGISEIPIERWNAADYYDPDPDIPGKMITKWGGFLKNIDLFDADFFKITPKEAEHIDPQHRLLLELTWEALEQAAIDPFSLKDSSTGIFIGISSSDYSNLLHKYEDVKEITAYSSLGQTLSAAAGRIAYFLGTQGPAMAIDTACSSSLVALFNACQELWSNDCDLAVAGGVNLILEPEEMICFSKAKMLSPDGKCKTFDAKADGYVRSEGAGIFILKRLDKAIAAKDNILAVIKGSSINQDGASNGLTAPNVEAQIKLIDSALKHADIAPYEIDFIETHGTGTSLGDPIEIRALNHVFKDQKNKDNPLYLGAVKSNLGHMEAAAGVVSLMKMILMLQHKEILPNLHFQQLNPLIDLYNIPAAIPVQSLQWKKEAHLKRRGGVSGFGFTGTNAHFIIEEAPILDSVETQTVAPQEQKLILTLSARSESALERLIQKYIDFLEKNPEEKIENIVYTTNTFRSKFQCLAHFPADTIEVLLDSLRHRKKIHEKPSAISGKKISVPTYPFEHQHCWSRILEEHKEPSSNSSQVEKIQSQLLKVKWQTQLPPLKINPFFPEGTWLLKGTIPPLLEKKLPSATLIEDYEKLDRNDKAAGFLYFYSNDTFSEIKEAITTATKYDTPLWIISRGLERSTQTTIDSDREFLWKINKQYIHVDLDNELSEEKAVSQLELMFKQNDINCNHRLVGNRKIYIAQILNTISSSPEPNTSDTQIKTAANASLGAEKSPPPDISVKEPITAEKKIKMASAGTYFAALNSSTPKEQQSGIIQRVTTHLCEVSGKTSEQVNPEQGFFDMGLDSLMSVELRARLQKDLGEDYILSNTAALDYPSIHKLSMYLYSLLFEEETSVKEKAPVIPLIEPVIPVSRNERAIAIIGMSCRFPGADNLEQFWNLLITGQDAISEIPFTRWNIEKFYDADPDTPGKMWTRYGGFINKVDYFSAEFFGISPREAEAMDPQQRILLQLAYEALIHGGYSLDDLKESNTGVFVGHWHSDYSDLITRYSKPEQLNAFQGVGTLGSALAGRLSYQFGFHGPSLMVDTACSSSLAALHLACKSLQNSECTLALACGTNLMLTPDNHILLSKARALAPDGRCKTFDESADGYSRGEGAGVVVLKKLEDAQRDGNTILGIILASEMNQDGPSSGLTVPNRLAQEMLLRKTIASSGKNAESIQFIETHGTGTPLGDPIETAAIAEVYGKNRNADNALFLGAVKTNIGHLEGAAGIAGIIKVVLAMQNKIIPGNLHFKRLNPKIPNDNGILKFPSAPTAWDSPSQKRLAAVSSFGISGTNAHVILEEGDGIQKKYSTASFEERRYWLPTIKKNFSQTKKVNTSIYMEHQIKGQPLFPMSGYVAWIMEMATLLPGENALILRNLKIHSPCSLKTNSTLEIELNYDSSTHSYEGACRTNNGGLLADWILESLEDAEPFKTLNQEEYRLRQNNVQKLQFSEKYEQLFQLGFEFGPQFRVLKEVWVGDSYVFADLQADSLMQLIEGGLQSVAAFFISKGQIEIAYLPKEIGQLYLYGTNLSKLTVYTKIRHFSDQLLKADLIFFDEKNQIQIKIENFIAEATAGTTNNILHKITTQSAGVQNYQELNNCFYEMKWLPQSLDLHSTKSKETKKWLVISNTLPTGPLMDSARSHSTFSIEEINNSNILAEQLSLGFTDIVFVVPQITSFEDFESSVVKPLLSLVQMLIKMPCDIPPLFLITTNGQYIQTEDCVDPFHASLAGFYRTLRLEQPHMKLLWLDVDPMSSWDSYLQVEPATGGCIAYRNQQRYSATLTATSLLKSPYELQFKQKGAIEHLKTEALTLPEVADNQIQIRITASSLNFRDVMNVLGLYPGEAGALGAECVGIIEKKGIKVDQFNIGDSVIGILPGVLASHVTGDANRFYKKPEYFTDIEAAGIPIVFITVYIGLYELAQLKKEEWFLIHSAAGGVGLAAIQYAKYVGAKIIATAGNEQKRNYLRNLGINHVFDSRDFDYVQKINELTKGCGVDVVLNYSTGEYIPETLKITAKGARFVEIGKRAIWSKEKMAIARPDVQYYVLAVDEKINKEPEFTQDYLAKIIPLFQQKIFTPLPVTCFDFKEAHTAFHFLKNAQHIGKVIIIQSRPIQIHTQGTYLITGGLGALGLHFAKWLVQNNAGKIVLLGRSKPDEKTSNLIETLRNQGAIIEVHTIDLSNLSELSQLIQSLEPSLKGIIHAAGIKDDALIPEQTLEKFHNVFAAKAIGAWNIQELIKNISLDFCILFSSIAGILGSPGQINYAMANAFLDGLAQKARFGIDTKTISINWSAWAGGGMFNKTQTNEMGVKPFEPEQGLQLFTQFIEVASSPQILIASIDWPTLLNHFPKALPWLSQMEPVKTDQKKGTFIDSLKNAPPGKRSELLQTHIENLLRRTLKLTPAMQLSMNQGFFDIGFDSLLSLEFRNNLQADLGEAYLIPQTLMYDYPSMDKIIQYLEQDLFKELFQTSVIVDEFAEKKEKLAAEFLKMNIEDIKKLRGSY